MSSATTTVTHEKEVHPMPTVIYRDDNRTEQARIAKRLAPMPDLGNPCCEVTTNPTRTITRIHYASTQAPQPAPPATPADPFQQRATGGWGSASDNPGDDIYR
jgi:hypothetical protein